MMAIGAAASLVTVLGAPWLAQLAFRGRTAATKLVVGGFVTRMVLLFAVAAALRWSQG
jgi:hypothetical protein